jgi:hypothetical protein
MRIRNPNSPRSPREDGVNRPSRGPRGPIAPPVGKGPRGVTPPKVAPQMQRGGRGGSATPQIQQKAQQEAQFNQMAQAGAINRGSRQQATQTRGGMGTPAKRPQATQTSGRMGTPAPQGGQQARPMPQMQRRKSGGAVKKK